VGGEGEMASERKKESMRIMEGLKTNVFRKKSKRKKPGS